MQQIERTVALIPHPDPELFDEVDAIRGAYFWFDQRYADALESSERRLQRALEKPGNGAMGLVLLRSRVAAEQAHLGQFGQADENFRLALALLQTQPQLAGSFSALTRENYGLGLYLMGRYDEALVTLGAAHRDLLNTVGPNDQTTAESAEYLGLTQLRTGRIAEGLQSCQEAYNALLKHYGPDSQYTLMALGHRGIAELAAGSMSPGGKDLALAADRLEAVLGWTAPAVAYFRRERGLASLQASPAETVGSSAGTSLGTADAYAKLLWQASPADNWQTPWPVLGKDQLAANTAVK